MDKVQEIKLWCDTGEEFLDEEAWTLFFEIFDEEESKIKRGFYVQ